MSSRINIKNLSIGNFSGLERETVNRMKEVSEILYCFNDALYTCMNDENRPFYTRLTTVCEINHEINEYYKIIMEKKRNILKLGNTLLNDICNMNYTKNKLVLERSQLKNLLEILNVFDVFINFLTDKVTLDDYYRDIYLTKSYDKIQVRLFYDDSSDSLEEILFVKVYELEILKEDEEVAKINDEIKKLEQMYKITEYIQDVINIKEIEDNRENDSTKKIFNEMNKYFNDDYNKRMDKIRNDYIEKCSITHKGTIFPKGSYDIESIPRSPIRVKPVTKICECDNYEPGRYTCCVCYETKRALMSNNPVTVTIYPHYDYSMEHSKKIEACFESCCHGCLNCRKSNKNLHSDNFILQNNRKDHFGKFYTDNSDDNDDETIIPDHPPTPQMNTHSINYNFMSKIPDNLLPTTSNIIGGLPILQTHKNESISEPSSDDDKFDETSIPRNYNKNDFGETSVSRNSIMLNFDEPSIQEIKRYNYLVNRKTEQYCQVDDDFIEDYQKRVSQLKLHLTIANKMTNSDIETYISKFYYKIFSHNNVSDNFNDVSENSDDCSNVSENSDDCSNVSENSYNNSEYDCCECNKNCNCAKYCCNCSLEDIVSDEDKPTDDDIKRFKNYINDTNDECCPEDELFVDDYREKISRLKSTLVDKCVLSNCDIEAYIKTFFEDVNNDGHSSDNVDKFKTNINDDDDECVYNDDEDECVYSDIGEEYIVNTFNHNNYTRVTVEDVSDCESENEDDINKLNDGKIFFEIDESESESLPDLISDSDSDDLNEYDYFDDLSVE